MRINGKKIEGPNEELIIIPRPDEPIVFTARAVLDMDEFDKLCPRPTPPIIRKRDGTRIEDYDDARYRKKLDDYAVKKSSYMLLKSLEGTEGLEWEDVDIADPSTWENYKAELRESGFSDVEVQRIMVGVLSANCLSESRLEEARKSFLAGREERVEDLLSQGAGQDSMPHGERVSG